MHGGQKTLKVEDPVKMHAYLQCLLGLLELCPAEEGTGMRSDQSCSYYRLVVGRGALAGVPLGAKYKVYCAMLKDCVQPGLPGQPGLALEDAEEEQLEAPVQRRIVVACDLMEDPRRKRPRRQSNAPSTSQAPVGRQWDELLCPGLRAQPPPLALQDEAGGAPAGGSASSVDAAPGLVNGVAAVSACSGSGAGSSGDVPAGGSLAGPDRAASLARPQAILGERMSVSGSRKILIEGVWARYEKRDDVTHRYERIVAVCPMCKSQVSKAWPRQSVGAPAGSLVSAEVYPLAFVGCWLSQCQRSGVVGSHRGWKPLPVEVGEYAAQRQWV